MLNVARRSATLLFVSCISAMPAVAAIELDTTTLPVVISQPGSYVLTNNVSVPSGHGIVITSGGVTLDLGGFSIEGPIECTQASSGLVQSCTSHPSNPAGVRIELPGGGTPTVAVRNGMVSGFNVGVYAVQTSLPFDLNVTYEDILVRSNLNGLAVDSGFGAIRNVKAVGNRWHGIACSGPCNISSSTVNNNGDYGVKVNDGSIRDVESRNNGGGFELNGRVSLRNVVASSNKATSLSGGHGVEVIFSPHIILSDSELIGNDGDGYHGNGSSARISNTSSMENSGRGFWLGASGGSTPVCLSSLTSIGNVTDNYFPTAYDGAGSCNTSSWQQTIGLPASR